MTISNADRQAAREQYGYACGYCGVTEVDVGNELELDHFQPLSQGGNDGRDNLVYACPACNRNKASYWPSTNAPSHMRILHPLAENSAAHVTLLSDGSLLGLTPRGQFHIDWLHLNRPQLIAMRQRKAMFVGANALFAEMQRINEQLQELVASQEKGLAALRRKVRRLTGIDL